jgi:hypothetical protein
MLPPAWGPQPTFFKLGPVGGANLLIRDNSAEYHCSVTLVCREYREVELPQTDGDNALVVLNTVDYNQ